MMRFLLFWIPAGVLEAPFFLAFTFDSSFLMNQAGLSLGLHAMATVFLFFCEPRGKGWWNPERLWSRNRTAVAAVFPFVGWMAMGLLTFMEKIKPYEVTTSVEEEMDFGAPVHESFTIKSVNKKERILKELDFLPFAEILAGSDTELKRGAIERLAEFRTAGAISLLEKYRSDPSADTRFQVTTALARIKKDFEEELHAARETLQKDTHHVGSRVSLSRIYLQYARSKLLDATTAKSYTSEALYHLEFAALAEEAPAEVFRLLIGVFREQGDWKRVLQILDMMEGRAVGTDEEIAELRLETYHETGRYGDGLKTLRALRASGLLSAKLSPVADWWGA